MKKGDIMIVSDKRAMKYGYCKAIGCKVILGKRHTVFNELWGVRLMHTDPHQFHDYFVHEEDILPITNEHALTQLKGELDV